MDHLAFTQFRCSGFLQVGAGSQRTSRCRILEVVHGPGVAGRRPGPLIGGGEAWSRAIAHVHSTLLATSRGNGRLPAFMASHRRQGSTSRRPELPWYLRRRSAGEEAQRRRRLLRQAPAEG